MSILKKALDVLRGNSSYQVIENHIQYHKTENRKVFYNGQIVQASNPNNLPKADFQRVMMFQNNVICL